ncbi:hypothetical protein IM725_09585, partial [Ramlibacter aquaticus]|nr:hypothetical protein [Ramlibacter aquaticus]
MNEAAIAPADDTARTAPDLGLRWRHGFAGLGPAFHTELRPTPLPSP